MSIQDDLIAAPRVPLRYLVTFNPRPRKSLSDESCYLPMEAISEFGKVDTSRTRPTSEMAQGYSYLEDGDVAYAKVTPCFENGKGLLADGLPGAHAYATTEITVMRPGPKLDARYLAWVLQSDGFRSPGESHMSGSGGLKRVPDAYAAQFRIPHPSGAQQRAIADFLDRETAQIDAFIAKNEQLITLLTERRAAVIVRAVTQGLDPAAQMRDSGVEALGQIRASWSLRRIRDVGRAIIGLTYAPDDLCGPDDGGTLVLRAGNIQDGRLDFGDSVFVTTRVPPALRLLRDDIVICARNGSARLVGKNALAEDEVIGQTWGAFMTVLRTPINRYLRWVLNSTIFTASVGAFSTTTINQLTSGTLHMLQFAMPPVEEQGPIAAYLDDATGRIDDAIQNARRGIDLARERRAALISAAVTGKIDVGVSA